MNQQGKCYILVIMHSPPNICIVNWHDAKDEKTLVSLFYSKQNVKAASTHMGHQYLEISM